MNRALRAVLLAGALTLLASAGASAASYVPGQVIVKFRDGLPAAQRAALLRGAGAVQIGSVRRVGAVVVRVPGTAAAVAGALNRRAGVAYAEPNYVLRATAIPNDPRFGELYALNNTGQTGGTPD